MASDRSTDKPISQWTYTDAAQAPSADLVKDHAIVRRIVEDQDMWLDGAGWLGHRTGDPAVDAKIRDQVKSQFVSDDVIGEMVENRSNGLLEQEADIGLEPLQEPSEKESAALEKRSDEIVAALSAWWDKKKFQEAVDLAVARVSAYGRGNLRAWVAPGNLVNGTLPTGMTLADALDLIEVSAPVPTHAVIAKDRDTQRPAAVILTGEDTNRKAAEIWTVDPVSRDTVFRQLAPAVAVPTEIRFKLNGRLPLGEARGPRIVTPPVRQLQALLNFITTMTGRTVETAGFRERYLANAEPPVMWLTTKPTATPIIKTDTSSGTTLYGVEVPPMVGAGILNSLRGLATKERDQAGNEVETIATPDVTALDPVDPAFATNAAKEVKRALYKRGKQGHLANDSTSDASGVAYQQARAQFAADLKRVKGPVEGMIRDVLECVLGFAGMMSTEAAGILDTFRLGVTLHITAGPITPDEQRVALELRTAGAIDRQTMMARVGVEDPVAELSAIENDPRAQAELWTIISGAIDAITKASGVSAGAAAALLKLSPQEIQIFETGLPPAPEEDTTPALAVA